MAGHPMNHIVRLDGAKPRPRDGVKTHQVPAQKPRNGESQVGRPYSQRPPKTKG